MWSVLIGGSAAMIGEVRGGDLLRSIVGDGMNTVLDTLLGRRYPSILPIVLSIVVLVLVSRLTLRQGHDGG
jgi:hypothetical protein